MKVRQATSDRCDAVQMLRPRVVPRDHWATKHNPCAHRMQPLQVSHDQTIANASESHVQSRVGFLAVVEPEVDQRMELLEHLWRSEA